MPKAIVDRDPIIFTGRAEIKLVVRRDEVMETNIEIKVKGIKIIMSYNEFKFLVSEVENARSNSGAG